MRFDLLIDGGNRRDGGQEGASGTAYTSGVDRRSIHETIRRVRGDARPFA